MSRLAVAKGEATSRKNRPSQRTPDAPESARIKVLLASYGLLIPTELWTELLEISENTLARLRHEAGILLTMQLSSEIRWKWFFLEQLPELPLLEESEKFDLQRLTIRMRKRIMRAFSPDKDFLRALLAERTRILSEAEAKMEPVKIMCCRSCDRGFPATAFFFKLRKGVPERLCNFCALSANRVQRLKAFRKRFGGGAGGNAAG